MEIRGGGGGRSPQGHLANGPRGRNRYKKHCQYIYLLSKGHRMRAEASASDTRGPSADHTRSRGEEGRAAPNSGRDSLVHSLLGNLVACLRHASGLALPLVDSHDRRKGHSITSILRLPWDYWQLPDSGGMHRGGVQ